MVVFAPDDIRYQWLCLLMPDDEYKMPVIVFDNASDNFLVMMLVDLFSGAVVVWSHKHVPGNERASDNHVS